MKKLSALGVNSPRAPPREWSLTPHVHAHFPSWERPGATLFESNTAPGRHRYSPSPREARTGRGVSELRQQPSSPLPSPPLVGGEGEFTIGSSRRKLDSIAVEPGLSPSTRLAARWLWISALC